MLSFNAKPITPQVRIENLNFNPLLFSAIFCRPLPTSHCLHSIQFARPPIYQSKPYYGIYNLPSPNINPKFSTISNLSLSFFPSALRNRIPILFASYNHRLVIHLSALLSALSKFSHRGGASHRHKKIDRYLHRLLPTTNMCDKIMNIIEISFTSSPYPCSACTISCLSQFYGST